MPPEIADSDAESEVLDDEVDHRSDPLPTESVSPHGTESASRIDFDEFIDPTQRLSDVVASQDPVLDRGTGSTEKLLRGLEKARKDLLSSSLDGNMDNGSGDTLDDLNGPSPLFQRKRGQSATDSGSAVSQEKPTKTKRPKTYSTKSRNGASQSPGLFADVSLSDEQAMVPNLGEGTETQDTTTSMAPSELHRTPRERDRPRRVISLLQPSTMDSSHQISTSTSSMGGYQSINLDFRGLSHGLDIDANPFGSVSQVSIDGEPGQHDLPQNLYSNSERADLLPTAENHLHTDDIERAMMTSPERTINPAVLVAEVDVHNNLPQDLAQETPSDMERPSKRRKTDMSSSRATTYPAPASRRAASVSAESISNVSDISKTKKRDRKPKGSKLAASSPAPELELAGHVEVGDDHHAMDPPTSRTKRTRRDTLDSSSQLSQASEPVSNTKRKRKKTKAEGASEQSSPAKNPSSELHLSDEILVGLPKEQYKPRPSRSRSNRSVEDESTKAQPLQADQHINDEPPVPAVDVERPKSTKAKGKAKAKKSKVKRAKTSGAALLKKSDSMLSEGEEDVIFMDEKPAAVKLDLPPDINILKKEEDPKLENEGEDEEDEVKVGGRGNKIISVEIPPPPTINAGVDTEAVKLTTAEAKKRGRKPSRVTPSAPTPEPLSEDEEADKNSPPTRPALAPKSANAAITTPSLPPFSPTKNNTKETTTPTSTHSPLKSTSLKSSNATTRYRVGLSKRQSIPGLLRKVNRDKKAPTKVSTTVKERKVKVGEGGDCEEEDGEDGDGSGHGGRASLGLRDKSGALIEWEF